MNGQSVARGLRTGWLVILGLGVLTIVEFGVAVSSSGWLLLTALLIIGLGKAALILHYFMHFHQLWQHVKPFWVAITLIPEEGSQR